MNVTICTLLETDNHTNTQSRRNNSVATLCLKNDAITYAVRSVKIWQVQYLQMLPEHFFLLNSNAEDLYKI